MKVIIAGGRDMTDMQLVRSAIEESGFELSEIVSGAARGADHLGECYAIENNIQLKLFPANWDKHKKSAGYIRNAEMAEYADALIAIWNGNSKGTKHMIELAEKRGLKVFIKRYEYIDGV